MFMEKPMALMQTRDAMTEIGMEVPTISDAFTSPKNRNRISMARMIARIRVWKTLESVFLISSAES